jgi:hypothetical protein
MPAEEDKPRLFFTGEQWDNARSYPAVSGMMNEKGCLSRVSGMPQENGCLSPVLTLTVLESS